MNLFCMLSVYTLCHKKVVIHSVFFSGGYEMTCASNSIVAALQVREAQESTDIDTMKGLPFFCLITAQN